MIIKVDTNEVRRELLAALGDVPPPTDRELEEFAERRAARQAASPARVGLARNRRDWIMDWSVSLVTQGIGD